MTDSADRFEAWIKGMDEEEFIDRIESDPSNGGFSDAQEEIALNIRQPADESELIALEREQESSVQEIPSQPVYDTRNLPKKRRFFEVIKDQLFPVKEKTVRQVQRIESEPQTPQQSRPIERPTFRERVASFFRFMRNRRPTPPTGEA